MAANVTPEQRLKVFNQERLPLLLRAKDFIVEFDKKEIDELYQLIISIYKLIDFQKARMFFAEWNRIKSSNTN